MDDGEEKEPQTPEEIDGALEEIYGELLDANQELIQRSRLAVKEVLDLKEIFLDQAARCDEIAELHICGAQITARTVGDILSNEWGVNSSEVEDDTDTEEGT